MVTISRDQTVTQWKEQKAFFKALPLFVDGQVIPRRLLTTSVRTVLKGQPNQRLYMKIKGQFEKNQLGM
jgi:hypothetical protein